MSQNVVQGNTPVATGHADHSTGGNPNNNPTGNHTTGHNPSGNPATGHGQGDRESDPFHENEPLHENHGLPSVNRRREGNKLVSVLGIVFILGAGMASILAVNSDGKGKPTGKPALEKVESTLPKLVMPAPAVPVPVAAQLTPAPAPVTPITIKPQTGPQPSQPVTAPAIKPPPAPVAQPSNVKPPLTWKDRKMMGAILVDEQGGDAKATPVRAEAGKDVSDHAGEKNELAAKLEPTVTKAAYASVLPNRNFIIAKGTTLDCALETAINSTVPGITRCRLTSDVYSDDGKVVLLDRGSQLVGEYQGGIKQGQARIFVLWTRAKTPNGVVVSLNSPGIDALGRGGLEGFVDTHFAERFGTAILITLLQDAVAVLIANQQSQNNGNGNGNTVLYGQNMVRGNEKFIEKTLDAQLNIPPTLYKNQGDHIQVMVARDLDFSTVYALQVAE